MRGEVVQNDVHIQTAGTAASICLKNRSTSAPVWLLRR